MIARLMNARLTLVLASVVMLGSACSGPLTKIAPVPPPGAVLTREGEGSACGANVMGLIPIMVNSRAERAYQQALERSGGVGLTNTKVRDRWYWIYIGSMFCTDIEGTGYTLGPKMP